MADRMHIPTHGLGNSAASKLPSLHPHPGPPWPHQLPCSHIRVCQDFSHYRPSNQLWPLLEELCLLFSCFQLNVSSFERPLWPPNLSSCLPHPAPPILSAIAPNHFLHSTCHNLTHYEYQHLFTYLLSASQSVSPTSGLLTIVLLPNVILE